MDPVDANIIEGHVQDGRDHQPGPAIVADRAVQHAFATDLSQEPWQREDIDKRNGGQR